LTSGANFNVYLPRDLLEWIDEQAKKEKRKRNNYLVMILEDLRSGRLVKRDEIEEEAPTPRTRRVQPSLRSAY